MLVRGRNTDRMSTRSQTKKMRTTSSDDVADGQIRNKETGPHFTRSVQHFLGSPRTGANRENTGNQKVARRNKKNHTNDSTQGKTTLPVAENDSYFAWDSGMKVYISDAWCVGEANYLRAWAYMHTLHESMRPLSELLNWRTSTSTDGTLNPRCVKPTETPLHNLPGSTNAGESTSPCDESYSDLECRNNSAKSCNMEFF